MASKTFTTIMNKYFDEVTVTLDPSTIIWSLSLNPLDTRHTDLNSLALRESGPLLRGLQSLNNLSEMLLSMNSDIVLPGCQTFDDIRQEIQDMKEHLEESEQIADEELWHLDEETESLTAEQSSLEEQKKRKEGELEDLRLQVDSHMSSLQSYIEALETEIGNLQSAETTLHSMIQKRDEAETIRNVGAGLLAIPVLGWIAGGIMLGVGQKDLDFASEQVDIARSEVESCESQITFYSNQVSLYEELISEAETDIQDANRRIDETGLKLQTMSVMRSTVADLQSKTRSAVHQLGLLCGVGSVAELQTRRLILLEPVLKVVEEMIVALEQINEGDLLYSEKMESIMSNIRNNQGRLKDKIASEDQVQI